MKKAIFILSIITTLITTIASTGCQSPSEKADKAEEKVADAQKDLKEAEKDATVAAQKAATAEEWRMFKNETDIKIKNNETYIAEF